MPHVIGSVEGVRIPLGSTKVFALEFVGSELLAVGGSDNQIQIWDVSSGEQVRLLSGHTGSVSSLAFSQYHLISASFDTTLRMWSDPLFEADQVKLRQVKIASQ